MQNTVLDAGTDAKVAKFSKQGLEVVDLTFMDLFEIWGSGMNSEGPPGSKGVGKRASFLITADQATALHSAVLADEKLLRRASMISFQSNSTRESLKTGDDIGLLPQSATDLMETPKRSSTKRFFGKMFKKREGSENGLLVPETPAPVTPKSSRDPSETQATLAPLSQSRNTAHSNEVDSPIPFPPVLDLQATLIKSIPNVGRATSYIWIVRKWLKKVHGMVSKA